MTTPKSTAECFWSFSLDVYGKHGVSAACLTLQDELGLDVNILLFCCFAATKGLPSLDRATLSMADAAIAPWRAATVESLRAVRRAIKDEFFSIGRVRQEAICKQVQAAELECERIVQSLLSVTVPILNREITGQGHLTAAAVSLDNYLSNAGAKPTEGYWHYLTILLIAAIPGADEGAVAAVLKDFI